VPDEIKLTPTSYIVLGLIELCGEATPYNLKALVAASLGNFWSVPHAQLYTETERLAMARLLNEKREEGGRRRKTYSLTAEGRAALESWRAKPTSELVELRDLGLLKLFFGADPKLLAKAQLDAHQAKLDEYEALRAGAGEPMPEGPGLALDAGLAHEREYVRFWKRLAGEA
jgi:DNA-binding PadR family transcriptional regulator